MKVDENDTVFDISAVSFDKIFVSVFYWTISSCGLFLHILVLITTLKKSNNTTQNFHFFLHNLCITDCMVYLLYILYAVPCVLMSRQVYGSTVGYYMGLFENIDFIAIVLLTFIISINRAVNIKPSSIASKLFQKKLCYFMVVLSWLIGIGVIVVDTNYTTCRIIFEEAKFYFSYFCSDPKKSPTNSVSMIVIYVGVFSVALVYCISILQIWKQRNSIDGSNHQQRSNLNKYRNRLFYQALIIWLSLAINVLSFIVVPLLLTGLASVVVEGLFVLVQSMVTPICMLMFSKETRRDVLRLITCNLQLQHATTIHTLQR